MTAVTTDDVRDRLPELLARVAAGEELVITDGGRWVGKLAPPPTAEQEAERQRRAEAAVRAMQATLAEAMAADEGKLAGRRAARKTG